MTHHIKKLDNSQLEITGELAADIFEGYRARALAHLGAHIEVDGFRKGHVPENVLIKHIPENMLMEEMAEMALAEHYPTIVETEKIDVIGRPSITITKIAKDNPLGFKITTAVLPKITLPDYSMIAQEARKEKPALEVTESEVEETIKQIQRLRAHQDMHKGDKEGELVEHNHEPIKDEDFPAIDDEYVKQLGNFQTVAEFKDKLRDNIKAEKERESRSTLRLKIIESILEKTSFDVPQILTESELEKMMFRLKTDVENAGLKFDEYLKNINKTEQDIRKEWEPEAKKKASIELIIFEIAKKEGISHTPEEVKKEVDAILAHYQGADPERAYGYVEQVLTHEKVFSLLEGKADETK